MLKNWSKVNLSVVLEKTLFFCLFNRNDIWKFVIQNLGRIRS
jgi:hypothetical protein